MRYAHSTAPCVSLKRYPPQVYIKTKATFTVAFSVARVLPRDVERFEFPARLYESAGRGDNGGNPEYLRHAQGDHLGILRETFFLHRFYFLESVDEPQTSAPSADDSRRIMVLLMRPAHPQDRPERDFVYGDGYCNDALPGRKPPGVRHPDGFIAHEHAVAETYE